MTRKFVLSYFSLFQVTNASLQTLADDICSTSEFEKYYKRYTRYGPGHNCDINCKKEKLCNLVTSNSKDIPSKSIECKEIERIIDQLEEAKNKKV